MKGFLINIPLSRINKFHRYIHVHLQIKMKSRMKKAIENTGTNRCCENEIKMRYLCSALAVIVGVGTVSTLGPFPAPLSPIATVYFTSLIVAVQMPTFDCLTSFLHLHLKRFNITVNVVPINCFNCAQYLLSMLALQFLSFLLMQYLLPVHSGRPAVDDGDLLLLDLLDLERLRFAGYGGGVRAYRG